MTRKSSNHIIQAAGAMFLARSTQRYLFLLRDDDSYTNTWGLVGGRVESNETVIDALKRELDEEIGSCPLLDKIMPLDLYTSPDNKFEYHTFVCIVENEFIPKLNHEHKGYCWTSLDGIPRPMHPALHNSLAMPEMKGKLEAVGKIFNQSYVSKTDKLTSINNLIVGIT